MSACDPEHKVSSLTRYTPRDVSNAVLMTVSPFKIFLLVILYFDLFSSLDFCVP